MKLEITVCNVCKAIDKPTSVYTIGFDSTKQDLDLCDEHGAPLRELLGLTGAKDRTSRRSGARPTPPKPSRSGRRAGGTQILTLEQIEEQKRAQHQQRTG